MLSPTPIHHIHLNLEDGNCTFETYLVDVGSAVDVSGVYAVSNTYTPYSLEP
jgi:hypothetical protein